MLLPNKVIGWRQGRVDRSSEHFELRWGKAKPTDGWDDWLPAALVGPPVNGIVTVELLVDPDDLGFLGVVADVRGSIEFYLIDECRMERPVDFHPWNYGIYHCGTMSNVYDSVHWGHFAPDAAHEPPRPVEMPGGGRGRWIPDRELPDACVHRVTAVGELEFLRWLGQYLGSWDLGGATWDVGRRPDGYPEVWPQKGRRKPPFATVLGKGVKVADPPGPLGPRPVQFSESLAKVWLTPEELPVMMAGMDAPGGGERLLERIEQRILEHDEADQRQGWFWLWTHFARVLRVDDRGRGLDGLRAEFRASPCAPAEWDP